MSLLPLVLDLAHLQCKWAISQKIISGYNFWLERPTKTRSTHLSYILKALSKDTPLANLFCMPGATCPSATWSWEIPVPKGLTPPAENRNRQIGQDQSHNHYANANACFSVSNFLTGIHACQMKANVLLFPKIWWFLCYNFLNRSYCCSKLGQISGFFFGKVAA